MTLLSTQSDTVKAGASSVVGTGCLDIIWQRNLRGDYNHAQLMPRFDQHAWPQPSWETQSQAGCQLPQKTWSQQAPDSTGEPPAMNKGENSNSFESTEEIQKGRDVSAKSSSL